MSAPKCEEWYFARFVLWCAVRLSAYLIIYCGMFGYCLGLLEADRAALGIATGLFGLRITDKRP